MASPSHENHIVNNQKRVNYVANVNGFTLRDVFSYVERHNELNGENNQDGYEYNFSQNQGFEGEVNDDYINDIRKKMVKNSLTLLFLSSGLPLINMGDEIYTTHFGNNNTYCIDDEINYLQYNDNFLDITITISKLINLRKALKINYINNENYSLHSEEAWENPIENYNGSVGIYRHGDNNFYIAVNMTDEEKRLGIPSESKELGLVFSTDKNDRQILEKHVIIPKRSISIFARKENICLENM